MRRHIVPYLTLALVASGCLSTSDQGGSDAAGDTMPGALTHAFKYVCPPGGSERNGGGPCVASISSATESYQEPYLVIHPARPSIMVIGVNVGETRDVTDGEPEGPRVQPATLGLLVTEDGGGSWRASQIPVPSGGTPDPGSRVVRSADPALAFDQEGVLHLTGLVTAGGSEPARDIFYTSTADLGSHWTEPRRLTSDGDNDRPWISISPSGVIFTSWWKVDDGSSHVAWSHDGGKSWTEQVSASLLTDCVTSSRVVFAETATLLACTGIRDGELSAVQLHKFSERQGRFIRTATIHEVVGSHPQLVVTSHGMIALVANDQSNRTVLLTSSRDQGRSWASPVDLRRWLEVDDAWSYMWTYWFEPDPWGSVHFLGAGFNQTTEAPMPSSLLSPLYGRLEVMHAAFDPQTLKPIVERHLLAPGAGPVSRLPPSIAPPSGDDYYGAAFTSDMGYLVWTREQGIDLTALVVDAT